MQHVRAMSCSSRNRRRFSGEDSTSRAPACEGSSIIGRTSGRSICHGWTWMWTSKTEEVTAVSLREHDQTHGDRALGTCVLKLTRGHQLRMDLVSINRLETAFGEVIL